MLEYFKPLASDISPWSRWARHVVVYIGVPTTPVGNATPPPASHHQVTLRAPSPALAPLRDLKCNARGPCLHLLMTNLQSYIWCYKLYATMLVCLQDLARSKARTRWWRSVVAWCCSEGLGDSCWLATCHQVFRYPLRSQNNFLKRIYSI